MSFHFYYMVWGCIAGCLVPHIRHEGQEGVHVLADPEHITDVRVREQPVGISSHTPPCASWDSNSGHPAWLRAPLPTEPSPHSPSRTKQAPRLACVDSYLQLAFHNLCFQGNNVFQPEQLKVSYNFTKFANKEVHYISSSFQFCGHVNGCSWGLCEQSGALASCLFFHFQAYFLAVLRSHETSNVKVERRGTWRESPSKDSVWTQPGHLWTVRFEANWWMTLSISYWLFSFQNKDSRPSAESEPGTGVSV